MSNQETPNEAAMGVETADKMESLYQERLKRYVTAMRNEKPDMIPIRPFVAEFTAKYAGYTSQEVSYDYEKAFTAARKCAAEFDWDAVVGNMVYGWMALVKAIGLKYYAVPGIETPPNTAFQYLEPPEDEAWMRADEYDALIDDPTGYLYNVWLPRVSADVVAPGQPNTFRNNMSFVKGGMAMLQYFVGFGVQAARLRKESGSVSAISGILKAPFDILADKLRGYKGLCMDLYRQPKKVQAACEAMMPHLFEVALSGADPDRNVPIGLWMHRGCVPFVSPPQFEKFYWPTLKQIIEQLWARGCQTLFYAEGDWTASLKYIAELPERSIVFHVDRSDIHQTRRWLKEKFCVSGGIRNDVLALGTPQQVRDCCKQVIDTLGRDGGYVMDASAIMQDDTTAENLRAMTEATREFGRSTSARSATAFRPAPPKAEPFLQGKRPPGSCVPWEEKVKEFPPILGDKALVERLWKEIDSLGYTYIWQILESF
jgi:uroporphyrinogen-III decarboxylase